MSTTNISQRKQPRRRRKWLWGVSAVGLILIVAMCSLVAIPVISPATGAAMADSLRAIFGVEFVANLESASFRVQDSINRVRYQASGGQAQLNWEPGSGASVVNLNKPKAAPAQPSGKTPAGAAGVTKSPVNPANPVTPASPSVDVVSAPSPGNLQWQPYGAAVDGVPIMARAFVNPDPARPYAQAAIVRIDLSQIDLHLLPGTVEPVSAKPITGFKRPGFIPLDDQTPDRLLAAFNGGFKTIHGHYGMMTDGVTIVPAIDGLATIALHKDGRIQIGQWGRDLTTSDDLVWYRQNCPLLVDAGEINSHVNDESRKEWGYTVKNLDTTWRSGVGITQDGRFLLYAAGNSLTVESLAEALRQAGAYYAMQTDINGFYTRFVTYRPADNPKAAGHPLVADKLLNEMSGDPAVFLHPYDRDFFYITLKS